MGIVFPPLNTLATKSQLPTPGEFALLQALCEYLPHDCEIFFQPYLNGDRPDVIILRKGYGIHIVEVKDWYLKNYTIDTEGKWHTRKNNTKIKSPLSQVQNYKDNIFNLHVSGLLEKKLKNPKLFGLVTCSVYFHNADSGLVRTIQDSLLGSQNKKLYRESEHIKLYGRELLEKEQVYRFIYESKLTYKSQYFVNEIYDVLRQNMMPPYHYIEEGIEIKYTAKQIKLSESKGNVKRKIHGVAGSGKTLVLAKRAVNAYLRTNATVLILTYNITLINYIHDLINNVRAGFAWEYFEIISYHEFMNTVCNRMNLVSDTSLDYENIDLFDSCATKIQKYKAIFIDEAQDYHESWHKIIQKYFLTDDGEYVVFADEKQNIYGNMLDENKYIKVPGIPGQWAENIATPFRYHSRILDFLKSYQFEMFSIKYHVDQFEHLHQAEANLGESEINYQYLNSPADVSRIYEIISHFLEDNKIHPSDTTILNSRIELLRNLDHHIRKKSIRTTTTFEAKEDFDNIHHGDGTEVVHRVLDVIRRNKKRHFMMKTGTMKISTIHSFKGWEINTAIVLIEKEELQNEFETAELIYVGISRARNHLLILNIGNAKYNELIKKIL